MNPHMKRWVTGVTAVPILIVAIAYGSEWVFTLLVASVSLLGMAEYNRMFLGTGMFCEKMETMAAALLIMMAAAAGDMVLLVALLSFSVMVVLILNLLRLREGGSDMTPVGRVILGIVYIPLLMSHFLLIRQAPEGVLWIFFILVMAFSGDTVAYYVGRGMGKRKLLPSVSPGKTVEGTIGLIIGSVVGALVFRQLFFQLLPMAHAVILAFMGSIIGQLGDLSESALKRTVGAKDSGDLLPGHGGILDRLDCLMFISPFVYYYKVFIIQ